MSPHKPSDNNGEPPDDGDDSIKAVKDVSMEWLARVDAARHRAAMEEIQRLARELDQAEDFGKLVTETQLRAKLQTRELVKFVASKPSNLAIQRRLDEIFATIQFGTGVPEVIHAVLVIIDALIAQLEQLGAWARLEPWFMQMYPTLVDHAPKDIPRWQRMMVLHCKYTGQRTRLDSTIDDLLETPEAYPHEHLLLILLRSTTTEEEHATISSDLLDIANYTKNYRLMMQVHEYKASRHLENFQFAQAFAHAQQAFILANLLRDGRHLGLGAWYMASVFHQHNSQPAKALFYLDLARDHADAIDDRQWLAQMQAIRGFTYHTLKRNQDAVAELQMVLTHLDPDGILYARVLYVWCAAMSYLTPTRAQFAEIETKLVKAMGIFERQRSYSDILLVHMAMVQIYLDQEKPSEAQVYYRDTLEPLIEQPTKPISALHQYYIEALRQQLNKLGLIA